MILNSPRGTTDIYGNHLDYRNYIIQTAKQQFKIFNYQQIITPTFEHSEVFSRSIGQSTDIVQKEMYTFQDKKGRSLTLRPEGTASVVRAVVENKLYAQNLPLKLFYAGNMFRYERPQKGRMREFFQLGVEALGSNNPLIDAEIIWLATSIFSQLGFKDLNLLINSIGCGSCRQDYIKIFKSYIKPRLENMCGDCQLRFKNNPLRMFDCKKSECRDHLKDSPKISDHLCGECQNHLNQVIGHLEKLGINFRIDPGMVRGFDYYTRTIFELTSKQLDSAQNALGGGGRYDNLIEQMGGPVMPAIGFAIGVDRTMLLMQQLKIKPDFESGPGKIYVVSMESRFSGYILEILKELRNYFICDTNFEIKNISKELKWAQKKGYGYAIIVGEEEWQNKKVTVKDIRQFKQYSFNWDNEKSKVLELLRGNKS